ncbi:MAG: response regulator [Bacteroides sp.]|uniref:hybrid sensor histidine kinase/response regulator n=1 Tax=Bacteroides sp. TaxID=29523 RepID=UPI001B4A0707|nr:ATP-binding protein [Bacteroides sp.]MBP6066442.1 response regulator [Bacteroides sp.]
MSRILHSAHNAQRILKLVADTLILVQADGLCVDVDTHSDLWFLQEEVLLGKNLFELMPERTLNKFRPTFQSVISHQEKTERNFRLELKGEVYYFKCIMIPYDGMVLCQYRDITKRKNIKLQLERVNKELLETQKAAQIGRWRYNSNEKRLYYRGYTGILSEEEEQSTLLEEYIELVLPEDRQSFKNWVNLNTNGEEKENVIDYRIKHNNTVYYIRLKAYLSELKPDGSCINEGYIQNVTDIQRRRNDINTLTHAINNAKESIFAAKADGTIVFANRQFKINHQIPDSVEIEALKVYDVVGDIDSLEQWEKRYTDCKPGESSSFIAHYPLKNNRNTLAFEGVMYHVTSDEGEVSYWLLSHDISDRMRYESQIKRLNGIMNIAMQNLPASITVKDIYNNFSYLYCNRKASNFTTEEQQMLYSNDFDFYTQEKANQIRREDIEIVETGKALHEKVERTDENGQLKIVDKRKIMVESEDFSPMIICIEWDITQLELMKRELMVQKEHAERANRLKSAFLANMSHEIRTPLNAIVGFSRIIAESEDKTERHTYYEIVEANNDQLLKLINEILDLSKIESGIVEFTNAPVKLNQLCSEIYDTHVFRCPPGVTLVFEPSNEELMVDSDKSRVFQVVSNLIGNAFKFTTDGTVSYGYRQEGDWVHFRVSDTGIGIAPENVDNIFDRFIKANSIAQGTGLGLSICRTIIERLGGEISLETELGKGTTFTFTLPVLKRDFDQPSFETQDRPGEELTEQTDTHTTPHSTVDEQREIIILIAEDTDSNYELLKAILGKSYRLERAMNGAEAVTLFESLKPDLILMDIRMPILNGLEATQIIREQSADVPIIVQSAYAYQSDKQEAIAVGCNDFISKPISVMQLKDTVLKWLNNNSLN